MKFKTFYTAFLFCMSICVYGEQPTIVPVEAQLLTGVCMTCHGAYGQGNPVIGAPRLAGMQPWYLKNQLLAFRNGWRGQEADYLPAYEMRETVATLSDADIQNLVVMYSQWKTMPITTGINADINNGQVLYQQCVACHGQYAEGNEVLAAPALSGQDDWYLLRQLKLFKSGYRGKHPEDASGIRMQTMVQGLVDEQDMQDVLAYINSMHSN